MFVRIFIIYILLILIGISCKNTPIKHKKHHYHKKAGSAIEQTEEVPPITYPSYQATYPPSDIYYPRPTPKPSSTPKKQSF